MSPSLTVARVFRSCDVMRRLSIGHGCVLAAAPTNKARRAVARILLFLAYCCFVRCRGRSSAS
jgi:hypothetical protein